MNTLKLLSPLAAALPLLAFHAAPEGISFGPEKDASISKSFALTAEFSVDDLYLSFGGQEVPPEQMGMGLDEMTVSGDMQVSVTEKYVKSDGGRPVTLHRTFDELFLELTGGGQTQEVDEFAQLEGETVAFQWDEEEGAYTVAFHESEGDEELLQYLSDDMDLRVLLPSGSVDADDSWEVPADKLYALFFPGGLAGGPTGGDEMPAEVREALISQLEGVAKDFKVRCTYKGSRDVDDVRVGEIEVKLSGTASVDVGEVIRAAADATGQMPEGEIAADAEVELEGTGVLFWNLKGGHVHSFTMNAESGLVFDVEVSMNVEGQQFEIAVQAELSGKAKWELTTD